MDFAASTAALDAAFRAGALVGVCGGIAFVVGCYFVARWVQDRRP